jgi:hypothetical protein
MLGLRGTRVGGGGSICGVDTPSRTQPPIIWTGDVFRLPLVCRSLPLHLTIRQSHGFFASFRTAASRVRCVRTGFPEDSQFFALFIVPWVVLDLHVGCNTGRSPPLTSLFLSAISQMIFNKNWLPSSLPWRKNFERQYSVSGSLPSRLHSIFFLASTSCPVSQDARRYP